jgi:SAM-dependent methyltransferase
MGDLAVGARVWPEEAALLECPHCGGDLAHDDFRCTRPGCGSRFRSLLGIPDLRIVQDAAVDYEQDWTLACSLAEAYPSASFRDLLERLWQARVRQELVTRERAEMRIAQIQRTRLKHTQDMDDTGWLGNLVPRDTRARVLDLGCGPGGFLLPAGRVFGSAAGIDISMAWLVICRKRLEAERIPAVLVCACAERLPFRRDTFDLVIAFDTLEHVVDRDRMVGEAHRVARPGGIVVCTTPNRFSLSAEPHYKVWGVGLLPRAWMSGYVRWRTGQEYRFTYLLSILDIRRLFARHFAGGCRIVVPELWGEDIQTFSLAKRVAARLYNLVIRLKVSRAALTFVAPFFRIVARKNDAGY